jgi:hypothetical protein
MMEQMILNWLTTHIPMVATWIIGIGVVSVGIKKYGPKIRRFVHVGRHGMDVIDTLLDAVQDNNITEEEITRIVAEVNKFKESLK